MKRFSLLTLTLAFVASLALAQTEPEFHHEINDYDTELNHLGRVLADYQSLTSGGNMYYSPVTTTTGYSPPVTTTTNMYSPPVTTTTNMYSPPVTTTTNMYSPPVTTTASNIYSVPVTTTTYSSPVASTNCPVNCPPAVKAELARELKGLLRITDMALELKHKIFGLVQKAQEAEKLALKYAAECAALTGSNPIITTGTGGYMYGAGESETEDEGDATVQGANYTGKDYYAYKTPLYSSFHYKPSYSPPVSSPGPCALAVKYAKEAALLMNKIKILEHELRALLYEGSVLMGSISQLADKCQVVTVTTSTPIYQPPVTSAPVYPQPVTSAPVYQPPVTNAPYQPPVTNAPYQPPVTNAPYQQQSMNPTTPTVPTTSGGNRMLNYASTGYPTSSSYYPPLSSPTSYSLQNLEECLIRLHKLLERARALTKAALTYVAASQVLENRLAIAEAQLQRCLRLQSTITTYPSYSAPVTSGPRYLEEDHDEYRSSSDDDDVQAAGYTYPPVVTAPPCQAEAAAVAQLQRDVCTVELSLLDTLSKLGNTWAAIDDLSNRCFGVTTVYTAYPPVSSPLYDNIPLSSGRNYRRLRGSDNDAEIAE